MRLGKWYPLGYELGADDDVDLLRVHRPHEFGGACRGPNGVASDDRGAGVGVMGLDIDPPRLVATTGAAGDLLDLLEAAFRRTKVAALQAEIGVDHADQGEVGEMIALGHELGADDNVDLLRVHRPDEFGGASRGPDGVAGDDRGARVGEQRRDLVGNTLDPGTAGDQRILVAAFGAQSRRGHDVAAMVAGEAVHQPVLDHPGGAIGALEAMAAVAA